MRTRGEGVKKSQNFADFIYGWPLGGTRCVKTVVGDTLFIGFRGTASKMDWKSNAQFSLVALEDEDSNVRVFE